MFTATHFGLRGREGSTDWRYSRRIWSGKHWGETCGSGCGDFCWGYTLIPASIFLEKSQRRLQWKSNYPTLQGTTCPTLWDPARFAFWRPAHPHFTLSPTAETSSKTGFRAQPFCIYTLSQELDWCFPLTGES